MRLDVVIFGGGIAGLWLLDRLVERGFAVLLLEARSLGAGQTIAAQGIIHGGLKYTLRGRFTASGEGVREMPGIWRACLRGERRPDLRDVDVLSESCHLWRTESIRSRLGLLGARAGLRVKPVRLERDVWPAVLRDCAGEVYRVDEQVLDVPGLLRSLANRHERRLLQVDAAAGEAFDLSGPAQVRAVRLGAVGGTRALELHPTAVVFVAGEGNAKLRERVGLSPEAMQVRPLHMVMLRGGPPPLFGHCVDGAGTRATITTAHDATGRVIWHIGGQIAEDGVDMNREEVIRRACRELHEVVPGLDDGGLEWAAYRINRAEAAASGKRPSEEYARRVGNVITAWPTKLALAPRLAERIAEMLDDPRPDADLDLEEFVGHPRPGVAAPPWEMQQEWTAAP